MAFARILSSSTSRPQRLVLLLVVLGWQSASMPIQAYTPSRPRTFPMLVATSDAIVVVEMGTAVSVKVAQGIPPMWTVECHLRRSLRGTAPVMFESLVSQTYVKPSSLRLGSLAIVFIAPTQGGRDEASTSVSIPPGGFLPIDTLVDGREKSDSAVAFAALSAAIEAYRPANTVPNRPWDVVLNDNAARPIIELFNAKNSELRRWAIVALSGAQPTPLIGNALSDALDDQNVDVGAAAAYRLMQMRFDGAGVRLRQYAIRLPATRRTEAQRVECYLRGRALRQELLAFGDGLTLRLKEELPTIIGDGVPRAQIEVRVHGDRAEINDRTAGFSASTLDVLKEHVRFRAAKLWPNQDQTMVVSLWLAEGNIAADVEVECPRSPE